MAVSPGPSSTTETRAIRPRTSRRTLTGVSAGGVLEGVLDEVGQDALDPGEIDGCPGRHAGIDAKPMAIKAGDDSLQGA
jgi:hypothetical protein